MYKYAFALSLVAGACIWLATRTDSIVLRLLLAWLSLAFFIVATAYLGLGVEVFGKTENGRLNPLRAAILYPYHLFNKLSVRLYRLTGKQPALHKIHENVYLGCQLSPSDRETIQSLGFSSVLDLTCEFSETPDLNQLRYKSCPVLDAGVPTLQQLVDGATWIKEETSNGPVYVHCALGHGRSAMFVAAYLLITEKARTADNAVNQVKAIRTNIGLHPGQFQLLKTLEESLHTSGNRIP